MEWLQNMSNKVVCPYCHYKTEPDIEWEVVFNHFTISFKCDECKRYVRIYLKMEAYGELVKDG